MAEIDVFKAQLVRPGPNVPWGFRLHRGLDHLIIGRLVSGSPATNIGLQSGDAVTEIMNRSTRHMGERDAMDCINQNTTSLILTVERRVGGSSVLSPIAQHVSAPHHMAAPFSPPAAQPAQPVYYPVANNVNVNSEVQRTPAYQPYDMTGKASRGSGWGVANPKQHGPPPNFQEATPRPFDKPKNPHGHPHPPSAQQSQPAEAVRPPSNENSGPVRYIPEEDKLHLDCPQSRTFNILTSMMKSPPASQEYLPKQRSATLERVMAEDRARRTPGGPRMKVFMSQQYNNPMGLYSPMNVVETFATQAVGVMDTMERQAQGDEIGPSSVQKAVLEEAPKR